MKTTRRKKHPLHTHLAGGMALALLAALPATSLAENKTFLNGGSWDVSGNWSPTAAVPTSSDDAVIANGLTATIGSGVTATSDQLYVGQFSDTWPAPTGNGTLNIETGGSLTTRMLELGRDNGNTGTLNLTGGSLAINYGSPGTGFFIGVNGNGTLNMSAGTLTNSHSGMISNFSTSTSTATISGGTWSNGDSFTVGYVGTGTLNVQGTGSFSATSLTVGTNSGLGAGTGTLNLTGGSVTLNSGSGTLNLASGMSAGAVGTLNIGTGGTAGTLSCASISGGSQGTATVNFNHTGTFTLDEQLTGKLNVTKQASGTTILANSNNNYTGTTQVSAGSLLLASGGSGAGAITVANGATFGGVGSINGNVQVNDGGTLQVGDGTNASGILDFSLSGDKNLTMGDNTTLSFTLGLAGTHSTLQRPLFSASTWAFDPNQKVSFTGTGVAGTYTGLITGLNGTGFTPGAISWVIDPALGWTGSFEYSTDSSGSINFILTAVPEPTTFTLFGAALATLALRRRRPTA